MADGVHVRVGSERYAFDVAEVREVESRGPITHVPGAPTAVAGICTLRGAVLPVVELATWLGRPASSSPCFLVVAEAGGIVAGLAVDELLGVEPLPGPLEHSGQTGLRGQALVDGELIGVLDVSEILQQIAEEVTG